MKPIGRIMSAAVAGVMIFGLAACGGGGGDATSTPTKAPTAAPTQAPSSGDEGGGDEGGTEVVGSGQAYFDKYEAKDMGGRRLTYSWSWAMDLNSDGEAPDPSQDSYSAEKQRMWDNMQRVCEKYNIVINSSDALTGWADTADGVIAGYMANEPVADILCLAAHQPLEVVGAGIINKLSDIAPPQSDIYNEKLIIEASVHPLLNNYGFYWNALNRTKGAPCLGYNRDLLASLGLEDPKALYHRGEWNLEKFFEYCKAATKTDASGATVQWGAAMPLTNVGYMMMNAYDTFMYTVDVANMSVKVSFTDPAFVQAMEGVLRLFQIDKTNPSEVDPVYGCTSDFYKEGTSLFWSINTTGFPTGDDALTFDYGLVPNPLDPSNTTGLTAWSQDINMMIQLGVADPSTVFCILEELMAYNINDLDEAYESRVLEHERVLLHEDDVEMAMDIQLNQCKSTTIIWYDYPWEQTVREIALGAATISESIERNLQNAQDVLARRLHFDMGYLNP